jgi:dolichyl-phosphate beta-glucosyltransferase
MKNLCIIPFYNEANRIDRLKFDNIFHQFSYIDFLLINDGSIDTTQSILLTFEHKFKNVSVVNNNINQGKGESIRNGFLKALESKYQYVGFLDSDFATPFSEFDRLLNYAANNQVDVIFGSRILLLGSNIRRNTLRHYLSRIIVTFINIVFSLKIYDTQCGCKIFNLSIVEKISQEKYISKWLFDVEIFIKIKKIKSTYKIIEMPLKEWNEIRGSKIKFIDFIKIPIDIIKIIYIYKIRK